MVEGSIETGSDWFIVPWVLLKLVPTGSLCCVASLCVASWTAPGLGKAVCVLQPFEISEVLLECSCLIRFHPS